MQKDITKYLDKNYALYKQKKIDGRYITLNNIEPVIQKLPSIFKVQKIGFSFNEQTIYKIAIGKGGKKILCWSQMHGNESTGTKAMFDLFNFFINPLSLKDLRDEILKKCTLVFIPMLNPDGAKKYTRLNAQEIDLNRDAVALKAPESKLLKTILNDFKPQYCFNLHDQRTIFSVTTANNPATLSFLAPSEDKERTVTKGRIETMKVIVGMNNDLQELIPNQIGRYTDEFYPTATGDNFQKAGFNTILIEAGHYKDDYQREKTRKYNFIALISGIHQITLNTDCDYKKYFKIPNNEKNYLDIIYTNVYIKEKKMTFGVYFEEVLKNKRVEFIPKVKKIVNNSYFNANKYIMTKYEFNSIKKLSLFIQKD